MFYMLEKMLMCIMMTLLASARSELQPTETVQITTSNNSCPWYCECEESTAGSETFDVDCVSEGLYDVPRIKLNQPVVSLDISFNSITKLKRDVFIEFKELKTLIISFSEVEEIETDTFKTLVKIEEIDLSENFITGIESDMFVNLTNLQTVSLSGNPLVDVDPSVSILVSSSLKYLDLSRCKLFSLSENSFVGMPNLEILDLRSNSLRDITMDTFLPLKHLSFSDLSNNPWSCSCELKTVLDFVSSRSPSRSAMIASTTASPELSPKSLQRPILCLENQIFRKFWSVSDKSLPCYTKAEENSNILTTESVRNPPPAHVDVDLMEITYDEEPYINEEPYIQEESLTIDRFYDKPVNVIHNYSNVLYPVLLLSIVSVAAFAGTMTARRYIKSHRALKEQVLKNIKQREMKTFNVSEENSTTISLLSTPEKNENLPSNNSQVVS